MNRRPVNRCAVKGCPVIGHWPHGDMCPMHASDPDHDRTPLADLLDEEDM